MGRLKDTCKDFAENTTAHGCGRVASSSYIWLRVIWGVIVTCTLSFCIYQLYTLVTLFLAYPMVIERTVIFDDVTFPAVSFCNLNPVRLSRIDLSSSFDLTALVAEFDATTEDQLSSGSGIGNGRRKRMANGRDERTSIQQHEGINDSSFNQAAYDNERNTIHRRQRRDITAVDCSSQNGVQYENADGSYTCYFMVYDSAVPGLALNLVPFTSYSAHCASIYSGATAAVFDTQEKFETFVDNLNLNCPSCLDNAWIALKTDGSGGFRWTDNAAVTWDGTQAWIPWASGEPGSSIGECGHILIRTGEWRMSDCTTEMYAVCQSTLDCSTVACGSISTASATEATTSAVESTAMLTEATTVITVDSSSSSGDYDPLDVPYTPVTSLDSTPWFRNSEGDVSSELQNSQELTSRLYNEPINNRRQMGHQLTDFMQECTWSGIVCTPLNITGFVNRKYGNCFTFNSGEFTGKLKQTRPGQSYGFSMTLFLEQHEYIHSVTPSAGVRVLIHKQNTYPFMEEDGFNINVGQRTSVRLGEVVYKRLGRPHGNCTRGNGFNLYYTNDYTETACLKTCNQRNIIRECDCADSSLAVPIDEVCDTDAELDCMEGVWSDIERARITCNCPELCDDNEYFQSVSASDWPGSGLISRITQSYSGRSVSLDYALGQPNGIPSNLLKLDVYYEELKYEQVEEQPAFTVPQLFGSMGGQLGLWVGVSVLTMIEFIQFLIELFSQICRCRSSKVGPPDYEKYQPEDYIPMEEQGNNSPVSVSLVDTDTEGKKSTLPLIG